MNFPGFRKKALTFSYDDGCSQDRRLIALFDKYGARATFNLNSGHYFDTARSRDGGFEINQKAPDLDSICELYSGHEIGFHGVYHKKTTELPPDRLYDEIAGDIAALSIISASQITGGAYAGGYYNDSVAKMLQSFGAQYCRAVVPTYSFDLPSDFLKWHPTIHDRDEKAFEICDEFMKESEELKLLYIWGHSYELDCDDFDRWAHLEEILKKCAKDNVWCAANGEICTYVNAFKYLCVNDDYADNYSSQTLYFENNGVKYTAKPLERVYFAQAKGDK